jgi:hypothetical protein
MENKQYVIYTPNDEFSKVVQERLFELGFVWRSGATEPINTCMSFILIGIRKKDICYSSDINGDKGSDILTFAGLYSQRFIDELI